MQGRAQANSRQGIRSLIDKFGLDSQERDKTAVYVQDLTEFNDTIIRTQEKRFNVGYERIQLCLFSMLGIYTVNRLSALLSLQFKHLQFSIQNDSYEGPPVLLMEIRSEHTKQFLGTSQLYVLFVDIGVLVGGSNSCLLGITFLCLKLSMTRRLFSALMSSSLASSFGCKVLKPLA